MTTLATPACIHAYDLKEGESVHISWDNLDGADGYILECVCNKTFAEAITEGRSWENIELEWLSWDNVEVRSLSWDSWATEPLVFEIFRGFGTAETGSIWRYIDDDGTQWDQLQAKDMTWSRWESREQHCGIVDEIAKGTKTVMYRVTAYTVDGAVSDAFTSELLSVKPAFYQEDVIYWEVITGNHYKLLVNGFQVKDTDDVSLSLRYDTEMLAMEDFMAHIPGKQIDTGVYPSAHLQMDTIDNGEVKFKYIRQLPMGKEWCGCITIVDFIAKQTALVEIALL